MHWEIGSSEQYQKFEHTFLLPKPLKVPMLAFALEGERQVQNALSHPPMAPSFPIAHLSWQELYQTEVWKTLLNLYPIHVVDMAHYWDTKLKAQGIEAKTIMSHYNLSPHFKNIADWKELGRLSKNSRELAREYNFPLRILRLWERLEEQEKALWLKLWREQAFSKNIIQDIIQDYYELNEQDRLKVWSQIKGIDKAWHAKPHTVRMGRPFPTREVRDIVSKLRSPQIHQAKQSIQKKKRELQKQMDAKIRLDLPEDLETHSLQLKLNFSSVEQLQKQIDSLMQSGTQKKLLDIFNSL